MAQLRSLASIPVLFFALFVSVPSLKAQTSPNCPMAATVTTTAQASVWDNRPRQCVAWSLSYHWSPGTTAAIELDGAPDNNGAPGAWAAITPDSTQNTTANSTLLLYSTCGYYPWIRVLVTLSGTSPTLSFIASGYIQNPIAKKGGTSGPGSGGGPIPTGVIPKGQGAGLYAASFLDDSVSIANWLTYNSGNAASAVQAANFKAISSGLFGWGADTTYTNSTIDTAFSRTGPANVSFGNGTAGDASGTIKATQFVTGSPAVLPAATAGSIGLGYGNCPAPAAVVSESVLCASGTTNRLAMVNSPAGGNVLQQIVGTGGDIDISDHVTNLSSVTNGSLPATGLAGSLPLTLLAPIPSATMVANFTAGSAVPVPFSMPVTGTNGCSGGPDSLTWDNTLYRIGCHQIVASGTVNPGTAGQLAGYLTNTNAVSSLPNTAVTGGALTMGTAGSVAGQYCLVNGTSGSTCLTTPTGALGTTTVTIPVGTGNVMVDSTFSSVTGVKNFQSGKLQVSSGATGAILLNPSSIAYPCSPTAGVEGWINRGSPTLPNTTTICEWNGSVYKNDTIASWGNYVASSVTAATPATPLFTPSSSALQVWMILADLTLTAPGAGCVAANMVLTLTWTDDTGVLQSRDIISFPWAATLAPSSGATDGTRGNAQKLIRQASTTAPTYAISIPASCTGITYAYNIHTARLL